MEGTHPGFKVKGINLNLPELNKIPVFHLNSCVHIKKLVIIIDGSKAVYCINFKELFIKNCKWSTF
jgi:hypothetical protein